MRGRGGALGAVIGMCAAALAAAPAAAGPDLMVERENTRVSFGGCALEDRLAWGRVVIINAGDEMAELPLGIIDRYTRSLVAVYVPEHLDLLDHGRETTSLGAGDRAGVAFEIGVDKVKAGRLVDDSAFSAGDPAPIEALGRDAIMEYQRAFEDLGLYELDIDGIPGPGFREAVERFQAEIGRAQTGVLTIGDARRLAEQTGRALEIGDERAPGEVRVTLYVVVDPYNLVIEDDETNNIEVWSGVIDCS